MHFTERGLWAAVEQNPLDNLTLLVLADFYGETGHPWAACCRWAGERQKRPVRGDYNPRRLVEWILPDYECEGQEMPGNILLPQLTAFFRDGCREHLGGLPCHDLTKWHYLRFGGRRPILFAYLALCRAWAACEAAGLPVGQSAADTLAGSPAGAAAG